MDNIRDNIVAAAKNYIGRSFWRGIVGNYVSAYTCVHFGFDVYNEVGLLPDKPNVMEEYVKAYARSKYNNSQPFSTGVDQYFAKRKDGKIEPGDFVMVYYRKMTTIHFAIYIGNNQYIDTDPDRGYVDYTTLDKLMAKDGAEGYLIYDALSNARTLAARSIVDNNN